MNSILGAAGGRWTLKSPWHPLYLDELSTVYPGAQLVMTLRDPADGGCFGRGQLYHLLKNPAQPLTGSATA